MGKCTRPMKRVIVARKVGERFKLGSTTYEVVKAEDELKPCGECVFRNGDDCDVLVDLAGLCYAGMRSDGIQVCFKIVK